MAKSNSVGTLLKINNKTVGGVKSISGIEINADAIDVSDLGNSDGYKEKIPGFKDAGEVGISGFFDGSDVGQAEIATLVDSGDIVDCEIVFPSKINKTWSFEASVTKFTTGASVDDAITFEASLAVNGKPTLAATTTTGSGG